MGSQCTIQCAYNFIVCKISSIENEHVRHYKYYWDVQLLLILFGVLDVVKIWRKLFGKTVSLKQKTVKVCN